MTECLLTDQCHRRDRDIHRLTERTEVLLRRRVQAQVHLWVGDLDLDPGTHAASMETVLHSHHRITGDQVDPLHPDHQEELIQEGAQCHRTDRADGMEGIGVRRLILPLLASPADDRMVTSPTRMIGCKMKMITAVDHTPVGITAILVILPANLLLHHNNGSIKITDPHQAGREDRLHRKCISSPCILVRAHGLVAAAERHRRVDERDRTKWAATAIVWWT
jgi:hypothetical protein